MKAQAQHPDPRRMDVCCLAICHPKEVGKIQQHNCDAMVNVGVFELKLKRRIEVNCHDIIDSARESHLISNWWSNSSPTSA